MVLWVYRKECQIGLFEDQGLSNLNAFKSVIWIQYFA